MGFDADQPPLDIDRVLRDTFVARVEHRPSLSSTNDWAKQLVAEATGPLPLLVVADAQTAGRGRGTNRWWTGRGGLAMTLVLDAGQQGIGARSQTPLVALAAALAVVETVSPLLAPRPVGIHWPNDVVVGAGECPAARKLSGILVEVLPGQQTIVGIGVNTNNSLAEAPPELKATATTLRDLTGRLHDPTDILVSLLRHLEAALAQLAAEPDRIGQQADHRCAQRGAMLSVERGSQTTTGRCAGIAPDGALLLDTRQGRLAIYSGTLVCQ